MPSDARVERALAEIRKGNANFDYFFDSLSSAEWIKPLAAKRVFQSPPEPDLSEGWIRVPGWSASRYLARMAGAAPDEVLEVALSIKTENERVHSDFTKAAIAMPGPLAARWAMHETGWLRRQRFLHLLLEDQLARLVTHLVETGEVNNAFALADELLRIYQPPMDTGESPSRVRPKANARIPTREYYSVLQMVRPALVNADALRALALLAERVVEALELTTGQLESRAAHEDFSHIWRPRVIDDNRADSEIEQALASALRDAAVQALAGRLLSSTDLAKSLSPYPGALIRRVLLHALGKAEAVDSDVLARQLVDRDQFNEPSPSPEYRELLAQGFGNLAPDQQQVLLDWIDQGPDLDHFREVQERINDSSPTDQEAREYTLRWKMRRLAIIADHLPSEWKARYEGWVDEVGTQEFISDFGVHTWMGPTSPFSVDDLSAMSDADLIEGVRQWSPPKGWDAPTPEGLGRALGELAQRESIRVSGFAAEMRGQLPAYVQGILTGLAQAIRNGETVEWDGLLELLSWVLAQPRDLPVGHDDEYGELDPGWVWTRKEVASLLSAGFESSSAPLPIEERSRVWSLIAELAQDEDPTPQHEERFGGANMDPSTLSLNTTRGQAMHAAVRYGLWVRRNMKADEDETLLRADGFARMPELRGLLEAHLDHANEASLAVRSVYGQWFPWLVVLDATWAAAWARAIFARDNADRWAATWGAYITFNRPYDDVASMIQEQYRQAIEAIASPHPAFRWLGSETPEERLAEHVMVLYWRGRADLAAGGLLDSFYRHAPDALRGHAMEFLGRSLRETPAVDGTVLRRLRSLWDSRLGSGDSTGSAKELGAFGWWFSAEVLAEDWRLAQAEAVLKQGIRLEPNFAVFATIASLAPERPGPTARVLRMMLAQEKDDWGIDAHRDEIKSALARILAGTDDEARQLAVDTAHWLGSLGYRDFRPLVTDSRSSGDRQ
jgi:tetratricopeptide (TPR) repeat protein